MPTTRARPILSTRAKQEQLLALARRRQAAQWEGYNNIGDYHGGVYESDHVSPYTNTACNVDADVMVMLQDWWSHEGMNGPVAENPKLGYGPDVRTNINLHRLLDRTFGLTRADTYATNLFPFVKPGGKSSRIPPRDLVRAAREFALPQIRIVNPKLLICIGKETFNALRLACGLPRCPDVDSVLASPFDIGETRVWGQAHTSRLSRGADRVSNDWLRMKLDYELRLNQRPG